MVISPSVESETEHDSDFTWLLYGIQYTVDTGYRIDACPTALTCEAPDRFKLKALYCKEIRV